jgi:prevent-host-death family protein
MTEVASRELRNNTRGLLERVAGGEEMVITVDGRAVASLQPVGSHPGWMSRAEFLHRVVGHQADAGLTGELQELLPDTTDDPR